MTGEFIRHIRFGDGQVKEFAPPHIVIAFHTGDVKTFLYPQSVGKYIRFASAFAQQQAQADLEAAEETARAEAVTKQIAIRGMTKGDGPGRSERLGDKKKPASAKRTATRKTKQKED
ncbi:MAG: hypothetical protein ACOYI7_07490 [Candidatus Excrementavichristensenella sp.]|jgi:hypothetical protein|nr:hypothetical protein [Bacillota bacterium]NLL54054.1 hypothetical protein [Clostridiales bacterium]